MSNIQNMRPSEAARRLDRIVEADPANLRSLSRYSRTGYIDTSFNKHIYILLVLIPVLTSLSVLFYFAAYVDGVINGTPEQEMDQIMELNLKNIIKQIKVQETKSQIARTKKKLKIDEPPPIITK